MHNLPFHKGMEIEWKKLLGRGGSALVPPRLQQFGPHVAKRISFRSPPR